MALLRNATQQVQSVPVEAEGGTLAEALVAQFPGPALCATADGRVLAASPAAEPLLAALEQGPDTSLAALVKWVALEQRPRTDRLRVPGPDGEHVFDISLLPMPQPDDEPLVLLVGHNVTAEARFTSALVASRQLYKDLVTCSADFAWECKADGRFGLTTLSRALGYRPGALEGTLARDLLHPESETKAQLPFETAAPVNDVELWLRTAHGDRACVLVSAVPVFGRDGSWQGARGVCRDVTEERVREAELERALKRDRLIQDVVDSTRNELTPDAMLNAAARRMAQAMNARYSWIFRVDPLGEMKIAAATDAAPELPEEIAHDFEELFAGDGPPEAHDLIVAGHALLASTCLFR
jgi:PAS domain S-box-containing protein